jgi:hypothetical protein
METRTDPADWRWLCLALIRRAMVEVAGLIRLT